MTPLPALRLGCVSVGAEGVAGELLRTVLEAEIGRRLPEADVRWLTPTDALGEVDHVVMVGDGLPGMTVGAALSAADVAGLVARHVPEAVVAQRVAFLRSVGAFDPPPKASIGLDECERDLTARLHATPSTADLVAFVRSTTGEHVDPVRAAIVAAYENEGALEVDDTLERITRDAVRAVARREGLEPEVLQARRATEFAAARTEIEAARSEATRRAALAGQALNEQLAADLDGVRAQLAGETERREHLESELEAVYNTRTFRATARLRDVYGRIRSDERRERET